MKTSMKKIKQIAITSLALSGVLTCAYPKFCQNNSSPTAKPTSYVNHSVLTATAFKNGVDTTSINSNLKAGDLKTNSSDTSWVDSNTGFADIKKYSTTSATSSTSQTAITYLKSPELVATNGENLFVYDSFTKGLMEFNCSSSPTLLAESTEQKEILSLQFSGSFLYCLATNPETHKNEIYRITKTNGTLVYTKVQTQMKNATLFAVETKTYTTTENPSISTSQEVLYLLNNNKTLNVETIEESGNSLSSSGSTYEFDQYASNNTASDELIVSDADNTHITSLHASDGVLFLSYYEFIDENSTASTCTVKLTKNASGYYIVTTKADGSTEYLSSVNEAVLGSNSTPNKAITSTLFTNQTLYLLRGNGVLQKNESGSTNNINLKNLINNAYPNRFTSITLSSMTQIDDALYFTDPNAQVIFKLTSTGQTNTIQIFMENSTPAPVVESTSTHQFIRVTQSAELYTTPFSTIPQLTIPSGTNLVILAKDDVAFKNYYYCLYTTKTTNYYLYLKDTTPIEFTQKTPVSTPVKVLGSSVPIFALPSTIEDDKNQIVERLQDNSILTQSVLQTVKNSHGESFYVVSTPSGNTGYVRYTQINSSKNLIATQKVKCNGRTKRETKLFLAPSPDDLTSYSDEEIAEFETLDIENNTRVKLLEKISAGSTYTPAVYQNDSGQVYYGYILTEDIKSDDLTPLQIIGLALVGVNIILLIVIIAFRKRYTSSSNPKSTSGENHNNKNTYSESSTKPESCSKNSTRNLKSSEINSNNTQTSSSGNFPTNDTSTTIDNATETSNDDDNNAIEV